MPRYDIQHAVRLTDAEKDEVAGAITKLHTEKFPVPSLFVNVIFSDVSGLTSYIGGKRVKGNHILGRVRLGNRKEEDFRQLARSIEAAWERIIVQPHTSQEKACTNDWSLATLILMPQNPVGIEAGFDLPLAGEEAGWIKSNYAEFQRRADNGEERMVDIVNEIKEKRLI